MRVRDCKYCQDVFATPPNVNNRQLRLPSTTNRPPAPPAALPPPKCPTPRPQALATPPSLRVLPRALTPPPPTHPPPPPPPSPPPPPQIPYPPSPAFARVRSPALLPWPPPRSSSTQCSTNSRRNTQCPATQAHTPTPPRSPPTTARPQTPT